MGYSCRDCKNENTTVCSCCSNYMGVPDRFESKPRTNADRIRAMSDEELAEALFYRDQNTINQLEKAGGLKVSIFFDKESCIESLLAWLKKEA